MPKWYTRPAFAGLLGSIAAILLHAPIAGAATTVSGRYATVGDHRLYYEVHDPTHAAGVPIVLLHGGGGNIQTSFAAQLGFLAHHHRVIALEQRGHGHSGDVAGPLTYDAMATDTAALLAELGVRRADYAALSPDGIGHLQIFGGKLRDLWLTHPTADEINVAMLRTIRCPVLVVAGDQDEIKPEHTLLIYRSIPKARLRILPRTGHATFALRPEWINPMLEAFLNEP